MNFQSVGEILDFAVAKEEQSAQFYDSLAAQVRQESMAEVFRELAREELQHKAKLLEVKQGGTFQPAPEEVADLKIAEYVVDVEPGPEMSYPDALILAMKMEKAAFKLYNDLAVSTKDAVLRGTFLALAQEEARHKLRFELEYDRNVHQDDY
ncbi:MAG: ferritin family protein [Acidobacteria bacterium]|nr:ferritin family protein [Acidobacteriota bacterium]